MNNQVMTGIEACVFDAYSTLFDVSSVAHGATDKLGDQWQALSDLWRTKQLQYTWLRGLAGHHADFWQVTGDALDFALTTLNIADAGLRDRLMHMYLWLSTYTEVPETLRRLKAGGMKLAILSNGTPHMLESAVRNAGIDDVFDAVLSVEEVGVCKPHHRYISLPLTGFGFCPRKSAFYPPMAGMPSRLRLSVSGCYGATASVRCRNVFRQHRTVKLLTFPA